MNPMDLLKSIGMGGAQALQGAGGGQPQSGMGGMGFGIGGGIAKLLRGLNKKNDPGIGQIDNTPAGAGGGASDDDTSGWG